MKEKNNKTLKKKKNQITNTHKRKIKTILIHTSIHVHKMNDTKKK